MIPAWLDSPTGAPLRADLLPEPREGLYAEPGFSAPLEDLGVVVVSDGEASASAQLGLGAGGLQAVLTQEGVFAVLLLDRIEAFHPVASCGSDPEGDVAACGPAPAAAAISAPAPPPPATWAT